VLMRLRRLDVLQPEMDEADRTRFAGALQRNVQVADEWRLHYTEKMNREAHSRLDAMRTFFEECNSNPKICSQVYRPEALRRTIVQEILIAMGELNMEPETELIQKRNGTDSQLRRAVRPADFIWAEQLQPAYDQKVFWWLYNYPPTVED